MDFISKVEGALQELEESDLWLELLIDSEVVQALRIVPLREETNELISMFVTMTRNVKRHSRS
jgi:four helix bundle protein